MHARWISSAAIVTFLAFSPATASAVAAGPEDKCEARKLKATAVYASCRLKAEAKAKLKGVAPDYTKCEEGFAKKFGKTEEKAGPGVCPSEGDQAVIDDTVAGYTAELATLLGGPGGCPQADQSRTPLEVVADLRAAAAAEDWAAFGCSYHENAFVIDDQGLMIGRAEIVSASMSLHDLFGDAQAEVVEENIFRDVVRTLFTLDAGWVEIEDGVHTYLIQGGRIRQQTTHGLITFNGPPPEGP